ncbi:20717_t:CDS:2 [Cetraspora pellucida]|uniref:20717_t:CDS:1 n=1 Tax=Cetraspora pellucida TaxID=1433469 RepID=A0A9N9HQF2_9GLOM|nr:20717_t:CDS:2 [Cetraspora pellucida]
MTKPTVLVLGGLGFIGRNFIPYLVENELASEIRVVDKVLLVTTALNPRQKEAFSKVEVWQRDLVDRRKSCFFRYSLKMLIYSVIKLSIENSFTRTDGGSFDYVFNLAAETKYSQIEKVYEERVYTLSVRNAEEAARRNVKAYVEVSTAEIYQSDKALAEIDLYDKNPSKEDDKAKPWTMLNLVILRPTIVYGPGATMGLTPRIVCGRIYKLLDEEMKVLWSKDLKINTVHVYDVVRALWHVATWYQNNGKAGKGPYIYNLADLGNTDQERINKHLSNIFGIKTGFHGAITSNLAQLNLDSAVEDSNDKHMGPWTTFIRDSKKIKNTPLTPYVDKELLCNNPLSVDGTKITVETGFQYEVPEITDEKLVEMIEDFKVIGWWPKENV